MTNIDTALVERAKKLLVTELRCDGAHLLAGVIENLNDGAILSNPPTSSAIRAIVTALQSTREKEAREALEMAHALIQEAKGAEGPSGGFVTDHLDAAENWLDKVEAALSDGEREGQSVQQGTGWVYFNEDTGTEYARNHPVESGECPDATDIRPATVMEDALNNRVQELFHDIEAIKERQSFANPDGEREALPVQGGEEERARIRAWLRREITPDHLGKFQREAIIAAFDRLMGEESGE